MYESLSPVMIADDLPAPATLSNCFGAAEGSAAPVSFVIARYTPARPTSPASLIKTAPAPRKRLRLPNGLPE